LFQCVMKDAFPQLVPNRMDKTPNKKAQHSWAHV
jgi:hypothetical protein